MNEEREKILIHLHTHAVCLQSVNWSGEPLLKWKEKEKKNKITHSHSKSVYSISEIVVASE